MAADGPADVELPCQRFDLDRQPHGFFERVACCDHPVMLDQASRAFPSAAMACRDNSSVPNVAAESAILHDRLATGIARHRPLM